MYAYEKYPFLKDYPVKRLEENEEVKFEWVDVGKIWVDYEVNISKHILNLVHSMNVWWDENGKDVKILDSSDVAILCAAAAIFCPEANLNTLKASVISLIWGFTFDDIVLEVDGEENEKLGEYIEEYLQNFDSGDLEKSKKFSIYCNIVVQLYKLIEPSMSSKQKKRFRTYLKDYLEACVQENKVNQNKNLDDYLRIRLFSCSFKLYELYAEISYGIDVSDYLEDEIFIKNKTAATELVAYINDLYSYNKEINVNSHANLVCQVQQHFRCKSQDAFAIAKKIFEAERELFERTAIELIEKYDNKEIKLYIKGIYHLKL